MGPKSSLLLQWNWVVARSFQCSITPRRAFSSSTAWQKPGVVPVFEKSSSESIDNQLKTIRNQLIMPGYLSAAQQELVFMPKHKKMLINDEVVANIGGEKFRLEHIDAEHDRPSPKIALLTVTEKFQETDWDMLPGLLEGLNKSFPKLIARRVVIYRICQRVTDANRLDILLECLRQADSTGFRLGNERVAGQVMRSFREKGMLGNREDLNKAIKWSEMTIEMLEESKHAPFYDDLPDPKTLPEVVAPLVDLVAKKAKGTKDAGDVGKVEQYGKRLLATSGNIQEPDKMAVRNTWLSNVIITIYRAASSAAEVVGSDSETGAKLAQLASRMKTQASATYNAISESEWGQQSRERPLIGMDLYEKTFQSPAEQES